MVRLCRHRAILLSAGIVTPVAGHKLTPLPASLMAFSAFMVVTNLVLAALLFSKGGVEQRNDTIRLGAACLYSSLIIIPQTASFPGALTPEPFIGTRESALWLWTAWHIGFCYA